MDKTIQYTGTIERIVPPLVYVRIAPLLACSGCHAGSPCPAAGGKGRTVEVEDATGRFALHEEVVLQGRQSAGMQAVLLACALPAILVAVALGITFALTGDELTGAAAGLSVLFPYYGLLYLMRGKLNRKFVFTVSKIQHS
ncbi:MAG: SoxR reducing system RseC family protein [Tannerella sp.]|jgi:sigma-E factor negative regulatory protein RseC|nr:SoxR reducing system RseC family protein [Tannerella sp.]